MEDARTARNHSTINYTGKIECKDQDIISDLVLFDPFFRIMKRGLGKQLSKHLFVHDSHLELGQLLYI